MKYIGVDLGGTNLRVALIKNNKILKYAKVRTPKEKNKLLKKLTEQISKLMSKDVKGIGMACAGPLEKGIIKNPPNLPLNNFNLKKFLQNKFKKRVEVENDAGCVALAELKLGCRKKNFFILTLGTGIGGGIIINGELYKGQGYAGELGHIILNNGKSFENLAAWKKLKKLTQKYFKKELLIRDLIDMKDKRAKKILQEISMYLGQGIASLINILDPEIVVLSGNVKESGKIYLDIIKKQTYKYKMIQRKTPIQWTKLEHPGVLGAGLLVSQNHNKL